MAHEKNVAENFKEMMEGMTKTFYDLSEINSKAFNAASQTKYFEAALDIKKPEDWMEAHRNHQTEMGALAINYAQEVTALLLKSSLSFMQHCSKLVDEANQTHQEKKYSTVLHKASKPAPKKTKKK